MIIGTISDFYFCYKLDIYLPSHAKLYWNHMRSSNLELQTYAQHHCNYVTQINTVMYYTRCTETNLPQNKKRF